MEILDFVKVGQDLYRPGTEPVIVAVPEMTFLKMDGKGMPDPSAGTNEDKQSFTRAVGALYGIAYSIKMSDKKGEAPKGWQNFKVPPLEALWWVDKGVDFSSAKPKQWYWSAMLRVPDFVTPAIVDQFAEQMTAKKKDDIYKQVKLEKYLEGTCVQLMHVGAYDAEAPNIAKMRDFAESQGYKLHGKHHEIYFNDPRRTRADKLKTILRQPIKKTD